MSSIILSSLAEKVGGVLADKNLASIEISGVNSLDKANSKEISFFSNPRYFSQLISTNAGAVLVPENLKEVPENLKTAFIFTKNPSFAFSQVMEFFSPKEKKEWKISPLAFVHPSVSFNDKEISIGDFTSIGEGVEIGNGCKIGRGVIIEKGVILGENCQIQNNVTIHKNCILHNRVYLASGVVIGSDGFGYDLVDGAYQKNFHSGIVELAADVEVGANTAIDRARFDKTFIGEGTKIDNLVQIGHNVSIGKHCIICGQVGIAGSSSLGNYVVLGGKVGIIDHIHIDDEVIVVGSSVVSKNLKKGIYSGLFSARLKNKGDRINALLPKLQDLFKRVASLEKGRD